MSRFAGVWVGLKLMKDTVEATAMVDGRAGPDAVRHPRLPDARGRAQHPARGHAGSAGSADDRSQAVRRGSLCAGERNRPEDVGEAGREDRLRRGGEELARPRPRAGASRHRRGEAERLGITLYKIGQTFPLDMASFHDWAEGLDLIVVVEEKRKLIEVQIKEAIFDDRKGRRVYGWFKGGAGGVHEEELFPTRMALDPVMIAEKIGGILIEEGRASTT
jgi:indolepyruvate ferredoxin oxidoreductase